MLLMCSAKAAPVLEYYETVDEKRDVQIELQIRRDEAKLWVTILETGKKIDLPEMEAFPLKKYGADTPEEIFGTSAPPKNADCYFFLFTVCWAPVGTPIVKRGSASPAFRSTTGALLCIDSVAGRGPCLELRRIHPRK
jgi:hypothetical protein